MAKKIEIYDVKLSRRVDDLVRQLRECYPDGKVAGLNARHKTLSNKIGEIWQIIGYETRDDFFDAYGFEFVRASNAVGGRPVTVDGEELLAELEQRYDGLPKPRAYGILLNENPDLKGQLKTLSNKSNEVFGKPLGKVLKERGILAGGNGADDVSDADIQDMLDALTRKYKDASIKPSSISELKADNPQYKDAITAFSGRGKMIYGMTPKKKLIELGIYPMPKGATIDAEAAEVEKAIDELGEILCDRAPDEKPGNITDLIKAYPDQGAYIKAGKKMGLVDKGPLQSLGILSPTKAMLKKQGVRRVSADELVSGFADVISDTYVEPGDSGSEYLPPFIVGYDTDNKVELRTALIPVKGSPAKSMHVGDTFKAKAVIRTTEWGQEFPAIRVSSNPPGEFRPIYAGHMFDDAVEGSASKLSRFVGTKVVSVLEHDNDYVAQLEFTYLAELRSNTMIFVLRQMGIVKDIDVTGGMGWRFRMRMAARGDMDLDEPATKSQAPDTLPAMETTPKKIAGPSIDLNVSAKDTKQDEPITPPVSKPKEKAVPKATTCEQHTRYELSPKAPSQQDAPVTASEEAGNQRADASAEVSTENENASAGIPSISLGTATKKEAPSVSFGVGGKGSKKPSSSREDSENEVLKAALEAEKARRAKEEAEKAEAQKRSEEERIRKEEEERQAAEEAKRKQQEADYQRASDEMIKNTEEGYEAAAQIYSNLGEYLDSSHKAADCRKRINEIKEAERKRKEEEEKAKREAERQAAIASQEKVVASAKAALDEAKNTLGEYEARSEKISALESQAKGIEQAIAGLGLFKGKEKRAKQQELAGVMAEIAGLKKQNLGKAEKQRAFDEAQAEYNSAKAKLEKL